MSYVFLILSFLRGAHRFPGPEIRKDPAKVLIVSSADIVVITIMQNQKVKVAILNRSFFRPHR